MTAKPSLVSVVDDDESVRDSLPDLLAAVGFRRRDVFIRERRSWHRMSLAKRAVCSSTW